MKKRWKLGLLVAALTVFMLQMTVLAAGESVTPLYCWIAGEQVNVITMGTAPSDDGQFYLFALKTYETGLGNRTDYCATAPVAEVATFSLPLDLNTASSKLYSRFVVAVVRGGKFVPVSTTGIYITNPEVVATSSTVSQAEATGNNKGLYPEKREDAAELAALGAGYVVDYVDLSYLLNGTGYTYVYNGKAYQFDAMELHAVDLKVQSYGSQNLDVVMMIYNTNAKGGASQDLVYPAAAKGVAEGKAHPAQYAFNVSSQAGEEKLEAVMSLLAERYNGGPESAGSIQHFVIGNEVNSSDSWYYAGHISASEFSVEYAKQFRVCYNAIKSHNSGAKVYVSFDQRWTHCDGGASFKGKDILDGFNDAIRTSGNIAWCYSFHPYPAPLPHAKFWVGYKSSISDYRSYVKQSNDTKIVTPINMNIVTDYLSQPAFLAPTDSANTRVGGVVRDIVISELGFNSKAANLPFIGPIDTNEYVQAAAMVYAYKLATANPHIKAVWISRLMDNQIEVNQGCAFGLKNPNGTPKVSYNAFMQMDKGNTDYLLPYIGIKSWP